MMDTEGETDELYHSRVRDNRRTQIDDCQTIVKGSWNSVFSQRHDQRTIGRCDRIYY